MEIKAIYIGNDSGYWHKLKNLFVSTYDSDLFEFFEVPTNILTNPRDLFVKIYAEKYQLVFLDFAYETTSMMALAKMLNRNNEMRLLSLTALFSVNQNIDIIIQSVSTAVRLNHIKGIEIDDVVYDAISLLDVNKAQPKEYVKSEGELVFEILQPLRIGYIEDNRFHVETNSYLAEGEIVNIDQHPLMKIMPSTKVYVEKFYDQGLYYNRRFGYDLEFIYIDNDFFTVTNDRWKLYKELKSDPAQFTALPPEEQDEISRDMKVRREKFAEIKYLIDRWLSKNQGAKTPKKLKIMVLDDSLEILKSLEQTIDAFPYSLQFQTVLLGDFYQIKRSMPHLIVMKITEINTMEVLSGLVKKIKEIDDYHPFILIFGSDQPTDKIRSSLKFEQILVRSEENMGVETIKSMAAAIDKKLNISETHDRVFFKSSDPNSIMFLKRIVKIFHMTETELYLFSKVKIPLWTVFMVKSPTKALLTIVPHKEGSAYASQEGYYRCLINGAGEIEKANLRRIVNSTLKEDEESSGE